MIWQLLENRLLEMNFLYCNLMVHGDIDGATAVLKWEGIPRVLTHHL